MLQSHSSTRRRLLLLCATVMAVGLSACTREAPAPVTMAPAPTNVSYAPAPAPVVVQQAAAPSHGLGDMFVGAAIGSLATHALTSGRQAGTASPPTPLLSTSPPIVNKTVIHKTTIVQAPPVPSPAVAARPSVSLAKPNSAAPVPRIAAASYRPSTSYRTTSTTVRYTPSKSAATRK